MQRLLIAVCGDSELAPTDPRLALAESVGTALVDAGFRILCGGRGGVMAAVARGARQSRGYTGADVLGLLPADAREANPWLDIALGTGLGDFRNGLIARADAVVAIGGGAGTLSEMALAWTAGRPVFAFRVEGWSGRLADTALDHRRADPVVGVDNPQQLITGLRERLGPAD